MISGVKLPSPRNMGTSTCQASLAELRVCDGDINGDGGDGGGDAEMLVRC